MPNYTGNNIEVKQRNPKILYWSDWGASTGFATVGHKLIPGLRNKGFDCAVLGVNYRGVPPSSYYGFPVYPAIDPRYPHGEDQILNVIQNERPDILITLNDFDVFIRNQFVMLREQRCPDLPWVAYFPIDGEPIPHQFRKFFEQPTQLVCYSEFAKRVIHEYVDPSLDIKVIHHGVDSDLFCPLSVSDKSSLKKKLGVGTNFLIGRVDRNQPRKNPGAGFEIFSYFINGYNICECGNLYFPWKIRCPKCNSNIIQDQGDPRPAKFWAHMIPLDAFGDLLILTHLLRCRNHVIFPGDKICANCQLAYPMEEEKCPFCEEDQVERTIRGFDFQTGSGWSREALAKLVGCFDVRLSTTVGEGWGLNDVEALSCGVPVISTDCASSHELLKDNGGILIPAESFTHLANEGGLYRPLIDKKLALETLIKLYDNLDLRIELGQKGQKFAKTMTWQNCVDGFEKIVKEILFGKENL